MKDFQHRDKWFYVFEKRAPDWRGQSRYALLVPDYIDKLDDNIDKHIYYVQKDDTMWRISLDDLSRKRQLYNGRYHITKEDLEPMNITNEWREQINSYRRSS